MEKADALCDPIRSDLAKYTASSTSLQGESTEL